MATDKMSKKPLLNTLDVTSAPVGVIDIGSNSVRLEVFSSRGRNLVPMFNEKILAGLGRQIVSTNRLNKDGVERALAALSRYRTIADSLKVGDLHVVATAAVRDAEDGDEFVRQASERCGTQVRVLSGKDEARLTALGVLSGIPGAKGLVGDLGGGSLELLSVDNDQIGQGTTLRLGALRLMDEAGGKINKAKRLVDEALSDVAWLGQMAGQRFYAVGGAWRTLARIHMDNTGYGLRVLQHYVIRRDQALDLASLVASLSRTSLRQISSVPKRRIDSLPFSAAVLQGLLKSVKLKEVVISAYGLREGIIFDSLPKQLQQRHPLVDGCREMAKRLSQIPEFGSDLFAWTTPLFASFPCDESEDDKRLREAACHLNNIAWRAHPDYRGQMAFREAAFAPLVGIDHHQRIRLGLTVMSRYDAVTVPKLEGRVPSLTSDDKRRARAIGLAFRLGARLSGGAHGILGDCMLEPKGKALVLRIPKARASLVGETVEKRLNALASVVKLEPKIQIGT